MLKVIKFSSTVKKQSILGAWYEQSMPREILCKYLIYEKSVSKKKDNNFIVNLYSVKYLFTFASNVR